MPSAAVAEQSFDACWARTVIDRALVRTRESFRARGELEAYDALIPFISDPAGRDEMERIARRFGISAKTLHVRMSRLRAAFAKSVREELARTVRREEEIEPEIRYLLEILSRSPWKTDPELRDSTAIPSRGEEAIAADEV